MCYFSGLFDAEGHVSLATNGAFTISVEMANEQIPLIFQENFCGHVYTRQRENRKRTWIWKINSITEDSLHFINEIHKDSVVKKNQLLRLRDYLLIPVKERKNFRELTAKTIKNFKQPILTLENHEERFPQEPDEPFWEWLAGFIDGDGNFVCNEYIDNRNKKEYFSHQISIANIFLEPILYINDRIEGTITKLNRNKNTVFKWVPKRQNENLICDSIYPFQFIKMGQNSLFKEFSSSDSIHRKKEIIKQMKHLNSL